jgi:hypothetical protein
MSHVLESARGYLIWLALGGLKGVGDRERNSGNQLGLHRINARDQDSSSGAFSHLS